MAAAESDRPTILVTDAGRGSALSIIRSLGRQGWRVIAGDSDPGSLGFRSRYASERLLYPSPAEAPAEFVRAVLETASRSRVDLVIPVTDSAILPLSDERARFAAVCRVAMPEPEALRVVIDKGKTLELGARLGIPAPRSRLVDSAEAARQVASEFDWPIVLKPISSKVYRDRAAIEAFEVTYANGPEEAKERLGRFEGRCPVLVQEYCAGVGYGIGLLMHEGRPLAAFQHRRLHEVPLTGGASSLRESVPLDPVLYDHSVRLLGALRWTGLAMVEFKGPKLMEVNGRVWGSLPLAVMSGVDFPRLLVELYLRGPETNGAAPELRYRLGVRARNLDLDVVWLGAALSGRRRYPFLKVPGRLQGLAGLVGLIDPRCRLDNLALDDLGPGVAEFPQIAEKLWRKLQKRT
ncbi:MAG TPA: ATP-grasp domain-containing protein [Candidatus Limnocylindria bacterium]|nr:ATP-grasp domain-containing protein [Candidatus Limnocylindria bacterium]